MDGGRRGSRAGGAAAAALRRELIELRAKQLARRARFNTAILEVDEIGACRRLAYELFGDRGVIEIDGDPVSRRWTGGGAIELGFFLEGPGPKGRPNPHRRRILLFKGASHRELVDQVLLWKMRGGGVC